MPQLLQESYIPLAERAIQPDGTIGIKLIAPGWGTSGYYAQDVLERDIPRAFPAGTHMFWNHDTMTEESERPEGDLSRLAAVLTTDPVWEANGTDGPGMYGRARVFGRFASDVDSLAEHIGVSIRGRGFTVKGEAEGRSGLIVQEIVSGKSVDFVTEAGAGGEITELFEAAGRSWQNVRAQTITEAANVGEWMESRLHMKMTIIADDLFGDGYINREERIAMSGAIGAALDAYRSTLITAQPQLYQRRPWAGAPDSEDVAVLSTSEARTTGSTEVNMDLQELQESLATAEQTIQEQGAQIARFVERALLREAKDHVTAALANAELPDVTKARLVATLSANPPVKEGRLDVEVYTERIEAAVTEAKAEVAALLGETGRITGQGETVGANGPSLEDSQRRIATAMAEAGFGRQASSNGGK